MAQITVEGQVERCSEGLQEVIEVLKKLETTTTADVNEQVDSIKRTMVYHHLNSLAEKGWIQKRGTNHRIEWDASELPNLSPTASLSVPSCINFPK